MGDRLVVGLVKNPTRQGSVSGAGKIHAVTGEPMDVTIAFRRPVAGVTDLRTGRTLPDGKTVHTGKWDPCETLLFEVTLPRQRRRRPDQSRSELS